MSTAESGSTEGSILARPRVLGAVVFVAVVAALALGALLWPQPQRVLIVFPRRNLAIAGHMGAVLQNTDILRQNGIEARFETPEGQQDLVRLAAKADIVLTDQTHALRLSDRAGGAHLVANLGSAGRLGLVVPAESDLGSIEDLRGKSIATTTGTAAHRFVLDQARQAGLSEQDWRLVTTDRIDQATSTGADAATLWDPALFTAEFQGTARSLARSELFATVVFNDRLIGRHREVGLAALTSIKQAFHHFNSDPRQAAIWLAGDAGKPAPQMQRACMRINGNFGRRRFLNLVLSPELPSLRAALEADNSFLVELGYLGEPAELDGFIHGSLMDQVDAEASALATVGTAPPPD